jgi:hypothetical protein
MPPSVTATEQVTVRDAVTAYCAVGRSLYQPYALAGATTATSLSVAAASSIRVTDNPTASVSGRQVIAVPGLVRARAVLGPSLTLGPNTHLGRGARSQGAIIVSVALGVRRLGMIAVSTQAAAHPKGQQHTRALGLPVTARRQTQALVHARAQGVPKLSARAKPPGLVHARILQGPHVNTRILIPVGLDNTVGG